MKYLTTLEAAHDLKVSKQTLLNWLYAGKIPEPPRNLKGYRLWSESRVTLVKKIIAQGRLHSRTVVHRQPVQPAGVRRRVRARGERVPARRRHRHGGVPARAGAGAKARPRGPAPPRRPRRG